MFFSVQRTCPFCGAESVVGGLEQEDWDRWRDGEMIQDVWPGMTKENREVLISGLCHSCQSEAFDVEG